jgi:glycine/D-amino acid oxidase-like deaminating enzyme
MSEGPTVSQFDVAVVGLGAVGSSALFALAGTGRGVGVRDLVLCGRPASTTLRPAQTFAKIRRRALRARLKTLASGLVSPLLVARLDVNKVRH